MENEKQEHDIVQVTSCPIENGFCMVYCLTKKGEILAYKDNTDKRPIGELSKVIHKD